MASTFSAQEALPRKRISLAEIDAVVSAKLGSTHALGNAQPACFNRQVAMYLAARIGRWSTTLIRHFYEGRDHSTVCHSIGRIEELRESDRDINALLTELKMQLTQPTRQSQQQHISSVCIGSDESLLSRTELEVIANRIADRCASKIKGLLEEVVGRSLSGTE